MGRNELGRVIDKEALASSTGPRGVLRVYVPTAWAASGSEIAVAVPKRVECARCEGGGCDGCGRSGALKTAPDPEARSIRLIVPRGSVAGVALRVVRPFGAAADIEQLIVEVRCGNTSECVTKIRVLQAKKPKRTKGAARRQAPPPKKTLSRDAKDALAVAAIIATAAVTLLAFR